MAESKWILNILIIVAIIGSILVVGYISYSEGQKSAYDEGYNQGYIDCYNFISEDIIEHRERGWVFTTSDEFNKLIVNIPHNGSGSFGGGSGNNKNIMSTRFSDRYFSNGTCISLSSARYATGIITMYYRMGEKGLIDELNDALDTYYKDLELEKLNKSGINYWNGASGVSDIIHFSGNGSSGWATPSGVLDV